MSINIRRFLFAIYFGVHIFLVGLAWRWAVDYYEKTSDQLMFPFMLVLFSYVPYAGARRLLKLPL